MGAALELLANVIFSLFVGWLPERGIWRWLVLALYVALLALIVAAVVATLT